MSSFHIIIIGLVLNLGMLTLVPQSLPISLIISVDIELFIQLLQMLNIDMAFYSQERHSPYLIKQ